MMNVIFFGTQAWSASFLKTLLQQPDIKIVAVVTQPDKPVGRHHVLTASSVKQLALKEGLLCLQPEKLKNPIFVSQLQQLNAEIGVVIAYGKLIPHSIIRSFPKGCLNVHPSLLPLWRGPSPIQSAILAGDTTSGVTIMLIDEQMDHGPILDQFALPIDSQETPDSFIKKVIRVGGDFFIETFFHYIQGSIKPHPQQDEQATYCSLLTKEDGRIDWNYSANELERKIRAFHPWPGTWTTIHLEHNLWRLKILRAVCIDIQSPVLVGTLFLHNQHLCVATGQGTLELVTLQPEGKTPMSAQEFVAGYGSWIGQKFSEVLPGFQAKRVKQTTEIPIQSDD